MIHEQDPDVQDRQVILKAVEEKLAQNGLKRKEENKSISMIALIDPSQLIS